jgi:hypothetical protein
VSSASPVGDIYTLSGGNFPTNFAGAGPLTFNNVGDTSAEAVPGAGLSVAEIFLAGAGAGGSDRLGFQFTLTSGISDSTQPFGFTIGDIDYAGNPALAVVGAQIVFDFGTSTSGPVDISGLLSSAFTTGLDLTFISPASWDAILAATNPPAGVGPTQIVVTLAVDVQQRFAPEPSTLLLMALGLAGAVGTRARRSGRAA